MDISMESFHTGGAKTGAVLRRRTPTQVRTLAVYRKGDTLRRADHTLTHDGDVRGWTELVCTTSLGATSVLRPTPTTVEVDGVARQVPADTLPCWAGPVALAAMLAECGTELELHLLDEQDPTADPVPAHYSVGNPERVAVPGGEDQELGTVTLYRGDEPTSRHWFDSHEILVSDWGWARSRLVTSLDELLDGLHPEVVAAVREFLG